MKKIGFNKLWKIILLAYKRYKAAQATVKDKALRLMSHENKPLVKAGFPETSYTHFDIKRRTFLSVHTDYFAVIVDQLLISARSAYPHHFGTGIAYNVLSAIYNFRPWGQFIWFIEFLQAEQFLLLIEVADDLAVDRVLRIDLFRDIRHNNIGEYEFIGVVLHALKQFSVSSLNLSTDNESTEIPTVRVMIEPAI